MKITFILLAVLFCTACATKKPADTGCQVGPCTMEFKMITAKLISTTGTEVSFKNYKVIERATGKEIKSRSELSVTGDNSSTLVIADDSQLRNFIEKGTDLQLQITRKDDQIVKVNYKISGGKCACHISKLEGPDQIDIDKL